MRVLCEGVFHVFTDSAKTNKITFHFMSVILQKNCENLIWCTGLLDRVSKSHN